MKKVKILIDIILFIIMIFLMDISKTGRYNHEVLGITSALLLLLHIGLNFKWLKQMTFHFRKVKTKMKIWYLVDIILLLVFFLTILLGLITLFGFLKMISPLKIMLLHHILDRLSFTLVLIHLGFHLKPVFHKVTKNETLIAIFYIVYGMLTVIVFLILLYTLTRSYLWASLM